MSSPVINLLSFISTSIFILLIYFSLKHLVNGAFCELYFQSIDNDVGKKQLQQFVNQINHDNKDFSDGLDYYCMKYSLQKSPVKLVKLNYKDEHIQTLKKHCLLMSDRAFDYMTNISINSFNRVMI